MLLATYEFTGVSDLMFGQHVPEPKKDDETYDQYEQRTWQQKVYLRDGQCALKPFALKNALESAAKWLSLKISGERGKTFTARFVSGILVTDPLLLTTNGHKATIKDVEPVVIFAPSDGKRGGAKRVFRIFPTIHQWETIARVMVFDNKITPDVLDRHIDAVSQFIGFGSMRTGKGGINGRFKVKSLGVETVE
jgi:hypothetical protein